MQSREHAMDFAKLQHVTHGLGVSLEQLLARYQARGEQLQQMRDRIVQLEAENSQLKKELNGMRVEGALDATVECLSQKGSAQQVAQAKSYISQIMREIDKCIDLLKG